MIRLKVLAEGQSEETFVRDVLVPHLANFEVYATAFCLTTSRRPGRPDLAFKGGLFRYEKFRRELGILLAEDRNPEARFTTMLDLYGLPKDFPGFEEGRTKVDPYDRVELIEKSLAKDFEDDRLVPYVQLHEFESLVLVDPLKLLADFPAHGNEIHALVKSIEGQQPECVNDGRGTAPSKRIIEAIPQYAGRKRQVGPGTVGRIGIERVRSCCPHFRQWLERLESLESA